MPKFVTITGAASRLEISRYRTVKLVAARVLPGPIANMVDGTELYDWAHIVKCLDTAGMGALVKPECRA
jgi:hypothetical protein